MGQIWVRFGSDLGQDLANWGPENRSESAYTSQNRVFWGPGGVQMGSSGVCRGGHYRALSIYTFARARGPICNGFIVTLLFHE